MSFFFLLNIKIRYFQERVTKQLLVATDFHNISPHTMEVNGEHATVWLPTILQDIFYVL